MASSTTPAPSVDPQRPPDPAPGPATRYAPAALVVDVVRLLRRRGLPVSDRMDDAHQLLASAAELLRCLGIQPSRLPQPTSAADAGLLLAASMVLRAAGIEPNAVTRWPTSGTAA